MKIYHKKMLAIVEGESLQAETFSMSSPSKISKSANRAFSLPAGKMFSCPGETKACEGCYATKGRHIFGNVQRKFARNWEVLKQYEKSYDVIGCALELCKYIPKEGLFRVHESGDFHSQFAVDVWSLVVANNPHVDFYAYTRSFHLNFMPLLDLDNFVLWASTDNYNHARAVNFVQGYKHYGVKHAFGPWDKESQLPDNSFVCPVTSGKLEVHGACSRCKLCVLPQRTKRNVVFYAH